MNSYLPKPSTSLSFVCLAASMAALSFLPNTAAQAQTAQAVTKAAASASLPPLSGQALEIAECKGRMRAVVEWTVRLGSESEIARATDRLIQLGSVNPGISQEERIQENRQVYIRYLDVAERIYDSAGNAQGYKAITDLRRAQFAREKWMADNCTTKILAAFPPQPPKSAIEIQVAGQRWKVETFKESFASAKQRFQTPQAGGQMPWWGNEELAKAFASAVGGQLSLPNRKVQAPYFPFNDTIQAQAFRNEGGMSSLDRVNGVLAQDTWITFAIASPVKTPAR